MKMLRKQVGVVKNERTQVLFYFLCGYSTGKHNWHFGLALSVETNFSDKDALTDFFKFYLFF